LGLKDIYFSLEDKYYALLEKIDKIIPVTKVTDAIDSVFPSFILFILLIILIPAYFLLPFILPEEEYSFTLLVKDSQGKKLQGIKVKVFLNEEQQTLKTNLEGKIELNAKKGTEIRIEINEAKYKEFTKKFILNENNTTVNIKLELKPEPEPTQVTLRFADKSGKLITGKEITVSLSCKNSSVVPRPSTVKDSDKDGEIKVPFPKNCGKIVIDSVQVEGFQDWFGTINSPMQTIMLDEIDFEEEELLGDLRVIIQNEDSEILNNIKVSLMKGNSVMAEEFTEYGIAEFIGIETGFYDLLIEDPKNEYETKKVYDIEIENQRVTEKTITLNLSQKGTLKVKVTDKDTEEIIEKAKVTIENSFKEVIGEKETDENGIAEFALFESQELTVKVSAEEYLPEVIEVKEIPEEEIEIALEKITPENSGKLTIKLVDEDGKKVVNARVMLKDEDGSLLTEYPEKISNAKGEVKYSGIKEGYYYAYAEKYPAAGTSEKFEIKLTEETEIEFTLVIGKAEIELRTINKYGEPIPNTRVKVKSIDEEKEYALNAEGKTTLEIKADKRVHFEFYDPQGNYANYITKEYQLFPKQYFIDAVMEEQIEGENLYLELKGVYLKGEEQDTLVGGQKYKVLLELFVPKGENYERAGIHFRVGKNENKFMENDLVWIEKINAPNASKIKGKTWNPKKGENIDFDSDNLASANAKAKWANIIWNNVKPGIYQAEIEIKIKEEATEEDVILLNYRAWGEGTDYYYFPADNELGSSGFTAQKQGLYAETFEKEFNAKEEIPVCMEKKLCMTEQKLTDKTEEPYLIQKKLPFKAKVNGLYEYSFKIINNSEQVYDEPELRIKLVDATETETENAKITYYEIKTSEGNTKRKEINSSKTDLISLGFLEQQSAIEGKIGIRTINTGRIFANVEVFEKVNEGSNKIFDNEKKTEINIKTGKQLQIELQPELIPAWVQTPVKVTIKDEKGTEIEKARVSLTITENGKEIEIESKTTNKEGKAVLTVLEWDPKTKITFKAEKFEYETATKEIILSDEVFLVEPETINETLTIRENPLITKEITIKNLLEKELTIEEISLSELTGYFGSFINLGKMNAIFNSFEGQTIEAFPQEFKAEIFNAELRQGLPEDYTAAATGALTIKLKNEEFNAVYSKEINVTLALGQGEPIENSSCIEIVSGETQFSRQTTSQPVQLQYTLENSCTDKLGRAIKVNNLKAKIEWSGSKKGDVSLSMKGKTSTLKTTEFIKFASILNEREEFSALLTYTPNPELTGEEGQTEFNIIIEAELNTAQGIQAIQTSPASINGKIGNVDLTECIIFDPKPKTGVVIESTQEESQFTITNNCGMEVDLRFCDNDNRCSGGTEGGINVKPKTIIEPLTIGTGNNNTEQITVKRMSIPGIYGMKIEARIKGEAWREIAVYDVLVEPSPNHYFSLGDYTIVVPEKNVEDIIELYNTRVVTNVDVDASDCAWQKATEDSFWKNAGEAFVSAGVGAAIGFYVGGPIGAAIGAVVGFVACLIGLCPDPCDDRTTSTLPDYLINLSGKGINSDLNRNPPNLLDANLSIKGIEVGYNFEEAVIDYLHEPSGKETLPLIFEKTTSEYDSIKPVYGILTIRATEHNQQTSLYVPGNNDDRAGDIQLFGLPDAYYKDTAIFNDLTEFQKKFHVRAITKRFIEEIPPLQRSLDCVRPNGEIGGIGKKALPKIKLNWDWQNISFKECEEGNENYIYCDATQFAIMLNKRIHKIDEFMAENNYSFVCPVNPAEEAMESQWENSRFNEVEEGKIGIREVQIEKNVEAKKIKIIVIAENKTGESMGIEVKIKVKELSGNESTEAMECTKSTGTIPSNSTKEVYCEFELPETGKPYKIEVKHLSETELENMTEEEKEKYDPNYFNIMFRLQEKKECWAGTTTGTEGELFPLNLYLNKLDPKLGKYVKQDSIKFNGSQIPTDDQRILSILKEIKKLSHFNAYLIKDGFTEDFKQDFANYYENAFLGAATWFSDSDPETSNNELADYYKKGLISFSMKYSNGKTSLPEPGLYRVDVSINYTGNKWALFNERGEPTAEIKVEFTRLNTPSVNSIFYYLPFDGKVGEENFAYHRIGYGTGYINLREEGMKVNERVILSPSHESSNPLTELKIEKSDSITEMNSNEETRGNILNLNYDGEMKLKFYPSKATPVALRMWHEQTSSSEELSYFYGMQEQGLPVIAGDKLAFWKGLGRCRDFEGKFVQNYKKWDSKALNESQNQYEVKWKNAIKRGTTYLKTVFYTPIERNIQLKVAPDTSTKKSSLYSPNEENSAIVGLNGITGMQYNNASQQSSSYLKNITNVFELVKKGKACISQNDTSMKIYWNEQELYRTKGATTGKSINDLEDSLVAGENCIE
jgi:hypothetical protein